MDTTTLEELIARIHRQCASDQWYGGEATQPRGRRLVNDPVCMHFQFPPMTQAQLAQTEAWLGFALPPVLRALYTQLANGGFGPGAGLRGCR